MSHIRNTDETRPPSVLSIAGSDSGGGAGIQADLKTFAALGVHGLTAISALTAQTTRGVSAVHLPPTSFLREQIHVLLDDFDVKSVKIGMLADAERIQCVADALAAHPHLPMVLDPVMVASSGARLLSEDAIDALREALLPRAMVLTPNLPEAEVLLGRALNDMDAIANGAGELLAQGARWVLMKGGHLTEGAQVHDRLFGAHGQHAWSHARLDLQPHGTGCSLSSAIAAFLALGLDVPAATGKAIGFVQYGLQEAYRPGAGRLSVLNHIEAGIRQNRAPPTPPSSHG